MNSDVRVRKAGPERSLGSWNSLGALSSRWGRVGLLPRIARSEISVSGRNEAGNAPLFAEEELKGSRREEREEASV